MFRDLVFLAQFVQQQNENNGRITEGNKKRRLKQDDVSKNEDTVVSEGQIVRYHPPMNKASKVMLRQIMGLDASPHVESCDVMSDSFLIIDGLSLLNSGSSSSHIWSNSAGGTTDFGAVIIYAYSVGCLR